MKTVCLTAQPKLSPFDLEQVLAALHSAQIVALPTETVYGLAADLFEPRAIEQIYRVKGRPSDNPLIAHISSLEQAERLIERPDERFWKLAKAFWPGPLTLVLKRNQEINSLAFSNLSTIALRMPSHPVILQILQALDAPLAAPSANLSGRPSPTSAQHVLDDLAGTIPFVVDGGLCSFGIESTVVGLMDEKTVLLRPGAISRQALEQVLSQKLCDPVQNGPVISPGMKYRHYAPKARVDLIEEGFLDGGEAYQPRDLCAKTLYFHLRQADQLGYDRIAIVLNEQIRSDEALMNRLLKAVNR